MVFVFQSSLIIEEKKEKSKPRNAVIFFLYIFFFFLQRALFYHSSALACDCLLQCGQSMNFEDTCEIVVHEWTVPGLSKHKKVLGSWEI